MPPLTPEEFATLPPGEIVRRLREDLEAQMARIGPQRDVYCRELAFQIDFARLALRDARSALADLDANIQESTAARQALRSRRGDPEHFSLQMQIEQHSFARHSAAATRFWYSIQAFLGAVANISKTLWGVAGPADEARREALRSHLSISGSSPLEARTMRNHVEHFDERLDAWANAGFLSSMNRDFGPVPPERNPETTFLNFDPATQTLSFKNNSISVIEIEAALEELDTKLREAR
jgi:hypothetical protein